jgi:hypothetical protein
MAWTTSISFILLIATMSVLSLTLEVWGLGVCSLSIKPCWESGYMDVFCGERLFGNRSWIKNMAVWQVGGALKLSSSLMGWAYGNILGGVGDGSRTRFWHDIWYGDCPPVESFPKLFSIVRDRKDALVADHMFAHNNEVHWDLNFIKLVHDWE